MSLSATSPRAPDLRGRALDGRYELHAVIGEGTFGRVYRGLDRRLARPVAVKVIKPWWAEGPGGVERFEREARLTARVSDPRIVQIFDVGHAEEGLYYVAELVRGESVAARLRAGPLSASEATDIAEQLSRALASAHTRRVVHGDVKPANVLIAPGGLVKITDFGLARLLGGGDETSATIVGTPSYMAPEQARGRGIAPASDVYSIGVILYEMLSGHPPFAGGSPVEVALHHLQDPVPPLPPATPRALQAIVERALAKDPGKRFSDGGEMADALARTRGTRRQARAASTIGRPATDPSPQPNGPARTLIGPRWSPRRTVSPAARRRTLAAFAAVIVLLLAMVAGAVVTAGAAQVRMPDLRGLSRAAIGTKLTAEHLRTTLRARYSNQERSTLIAQSPAPGTLIAEGSGVLVTLSAGPAPVAVPRVLGFSTADAESSLRQLGLRAAPKPVPAPGVTPGSITAQTPPPGVKLIPGSTVELSVAETPRWRDVTTFTGNSVPFRIRGTQWRIVYGMAYNGTCTFIFFCSGPTAHVASLDRGTTINSFGLNDGSGQIRTFSAGPGTYQVTVTPGDDSASWSAQVQDYY